MTNLLEQLQEHYEWQDFADFKEETLTPIGLCTTIEKKEGNPDYVQVVHFKEQDTYLRFSGWRCSYNGLILEEPKIVKPKKVKVKVWE